MFLRGKKLQISKKQKESEYPRIICELQDKIEEEDDEVSWSNDSQSNENIVQSEELIRQLKNSSESNYS